MIKVCPECGSMALEYLPNMRVRCLECLIEMDDEPEEENEPPSKIYHTSCRL